MKRWLLFSPCDVLILEFFTLNRNASFWIVIKVASMFVLLMTAEVCQMHDKIYQWLFAIIFVLMPFAHSDKICNGWIGTSVGWIWSQSQKNIIQWFFSLKLVLAQYSLIGLKSSTGLPVEPWRFLSSASDNLFMFYQYILKTWRTMNAVTLDRKARPRLWVNSLLMICDCELWWPHIWTWMGHGYRG